MVMAGVPASDGRSTRVRPASHVWNAYAIKGAAPELNYRTSRRGSRGSASLPSPKLIVKPRGPFRRNALDTTPQRLQSKTNLLVQLTVILDSDDAK